MDNFVALIPLVLFLAVALGISFFARRRSVGEGGFVKEYFIGNRTLGGFVLAMTTIATYGSVSSLRGRPRPGVANRLWLGVHGRRAGNDARFCSTASWARRWRLWRANFGAVTVIDVDARTLTAPTPLANICARLIIVLFFAATMVAQFVGGAKLFEGGDRLFVHGGPRAMFGVAVIIFTTVGGFRGVAVHRCAVRHRHARGHRACSRPAFLPRAAAMDNIMDTIAANHPADARAPFSGGSMPASLYFTQWLLVGVFTFALPQSVVRCMGFKDTKALHGAMITGTVIIGAYDDRRHGAWACSRRACLTGGLGGCTDQAWITSSRAPSRRRCRLGLAGVAIIGPIAASISTVSSLLIASSSAIIKDVYLHSCEARGVQPSEHGISRGSQAVTLCVGAIVFALAVVPPDVIWKINMFAFGGLETAFFWVMVCGLFWKRAGKLGALLSMVGGTAAYCACMALGFKVMGLHQIVIGITVAGVLMVVGSLIEKRPQAEQQRIDQVFFPE